MSYSGNLNLRADHIINRFASSEEVKNCEKLKKSGYVCEKFWQVVQDDLNGSFHCKYIIDEESEMVGHGKSQHLCMAACLYSNLL